jgi:hypothetical protein
MTSQHKQQPAPAPEHPPDAQVHLRVPMAVKAQWVRESRARGMKLTDWLLQRIAKVGA